MAQMKIEKQRELQTSIFHLMMKTKIYKLKPFSLLEQLVDTGYRTMWCNERNSQILT